MVVNSRSRMVDSSDLMTVRGWPRHPAKGRSLSNLERGEGLARAVPEGLPTCPAEPVYVPQAEYPSMQRAPLPSPARLVGRPSDAVRGAETKRCHTSAQVVDSQDLEVLKMGEVAITYKIMAAAADEIDYDVIVDGLNNLSDDTYDVQSVEVKPLAFGLKFIQCHVVMDDGEGLVDKFEVHISGITGVGEVEVLEMGLL